MATSTGSSDKIHMEFVKFIVPQGHRSYHQEYISPVELELYIIETGFRYFKPSDPCGFVAHR
jgi:hypothetical protein